MGQHIVFCFCVFAHFSKFSMYAWGKKRKMLVFTGVYVCVKAKLTFVSFFFNFFFLHLSLSECYRDKNTACTKDTHGGDTGSNLQRISVTKQTMDTHCLGTSCAIIFLISVSNRWQTCLGM